MDSDAKLRPLYLAKILYEMTDEDHYLTTAQLIQLLEEKYGIKAHRQTIKAEVELLKQFGLEIEEVKSTQNRYNLYGRTFDIPELKLLIDAVESSKFISAAKSLELVKKLSSLTSNQIAATLTRNVSCEGRIKSGNEKIYLIIDTINEAINSNRQISFQYFQYNVRKEQQLKHNGEPYVITPLHLVWNGDYYYMIGVYAYKQRIGNFRVDRIAKRPKILDAEGTPAPEDFNIDEYINTTFKMFNSEHSEVELVCDNEVMDSIIDKFGAEVTTYANDMTYFRAVVNVAVNHVFLSWVFGFGGKVKIKSPEAVREKYSAMIKNAFEGIMNAEK